MSGLLAAGLLLGHGIIHTGFLAPRPRAAPGAPRWPFELGRSWLLSPMGMGPGMTRSIGIALVAAAIAGFGIAAVAALGILPASLSPAGVMVGAVASIATLGLYFHLWLVLGLVIDLLLLWAILVAGWTP